MGVRERRLRNVSSVFHCDPLNQPNWGKSQVKKRSGFVHCGIRILLSLFIGGIVTVILGSVGLDWLLISTLIGIPLAGLSYYLGNYVLGCSGCKNEH